MLLYPMLIFSLIKGLSSSKFPNFVFVLTDDQDILLNGMLPMTNTAKNIGNEGKIFKNAFVNSPICCPSRSTILTGKYPHNTNVVNNSISGNCNSLDWQKTNEPNTIASLLKNGGNYMNFYAGKYLNQYGSKEVGGVKHIPQGYDWWLGLKGNSRYYNYTLSINGSAKFFTDEYLTDVMSVYAMDFLNQISIKSTPFFMTLATPACHSPFTPAERHKMFYVNETVVKTPSFNATAINKHWIVQMPPKSLPDNITILDDIQKHRLQTLLAVDEMVGKVIDKLKELKVLDNTYVIFSSDNGYHIGQFTQPWDKRQPYETDIRVPFLIRGPGIPGKSITDFPISAVDILPTILDLAGIKAPESINVDGKSFKNVLLQNNADAKFEKRIYLEYFGEGNDKSVSEDCSEILNEDSSDLAECETDNWCKCQDSKNNTYTCVIILSNKKNFKYCRFYDDLDFTEAYNLNEDPYELNNLIYRISKGMSTYYDDILEKFKYCRGLSCI